VIVPNRLESPIKIGERSITREISTTFSCNTGVKPGAIKNTRCGIKKNARQDTEKIKAKNVEKMSLKYFSASFVTVSPFIFAERNGMITVTEASEAIEINIRSGTRKAA
jgi:hypothetical protein